MSANFSGAVRLVDLDDFITPSVECIKPIGGDDVGVGPQVKLQKAASLSEKISITLNDCLACSGCITSAETVLISAHSIDKLDQTLATLSPECVSVCSISDQSVLSLATNFKMLPTDFLNKFSRFFATLGVRHVIDLAFTRQLVIEEMVKEVNHSLSEDNCAESSHPKLPILSGICPGWVCYAEKGHKNQDLVLPHISRIRSPQQLQGKALKKYINQESDIREVFHFCVMPCFDKKLEATRPQFAGDVDLVVATFEMLEFIETKCPNFATTPDFPDIERSTFLKSDGRPLLPPAKLSPCPSYAESILLGLAHLHSNDYVTDDAITRRRLRNADLVELSIRGFSHKSVIANGFRNIQAIVSKLRNGTTPKGWVFIEMMACPSGCLNGGGQIRTEDPKSTLLEMKSSSAMSHHRVTTDPIDTFDRSILDGDDYVTSFMKVAPLDESSTLTLNNLKW